MLELVDTLYYGDKWLGIFAFQAKGTTWYVPIPLDRSQIESNLKGKKSLETNSSGILGSVGLIGTGLLFAPTILKDCFGTFNLWDFILDLIGKLFWL